MNARAFNACLALFLWLLLVFIVVSIYVGVFVVPSMVSVWRAQGLKEVPMGLQILVDAGDFSIHRGWWTIPTLFVAAIVFTARALKANTVS
jgi:type II secretory pathway component PulF